MPLRHDCDLSRALLHRHDERLRPDAGTSSRRRPVKAWRCAIGELRAGEQVEWVDREPAARDPGEEKDPPVRACEVVPLRQPR